MKDVVINTPELRAAVRSARGRADFTAQALSALQIEKSVEDGLELPDVSDIGSSSAHGGDSVDG